MKKFILKLVLFLLILVFSIGATSRADVKYLGSTGHGGVHTIAILDNVVSHDFVDFYNIIKQHRFVRKWDLILQTPGGSSIATIAIINYMMQLEARGIKFHGLVYGRACSAGSYIFLACNERTISEGALLLWHTASSQLTPQKKAIIPKSILEYINLLDNYIRLFFKMRTGFSDKVVWRWLDSGPEQWMTAKQAYDCGIATEFLRINFNPTGGR